jgi:hypothetical protein
VVIAADVRIFVHVVEFFVPNLKIDILLNVCLNMHGSRARHSELAHRQAQDVNERFSLEHTHTPSPSSSSSGSEDGSSSLEMFNVAPTSMPTIMLKSLDEEDVGGPALTKEERVIFILS